MNFIKISTGRAVAKRPSVSAKLASLRERLRWITPLAGSRLRTLKLILAMRLRRNATHRVYFAGQAVNFRSQDMQALREVLVELEYGFLASSFKEGSAPLVLDVGAHIGTLPIWLLSVCPGARILSVEADPETFGILTRNVAAAVKGGAQWMVLHGAAGASQGETVYLSNSGPSMSHRIEATGSIPVSSLTLAYLLDRLADDGRDVDILKVDIEGSEEKFLCAAPDALRRVKALVIELHPKLCNTGRVEALLRQTFDIRPIRGRVSSKPLLFCIRREGVSQQ